MSAPNWVAPAGEVDPSLGLGTRVTFTALLEEHHEGAFKPCDKPVWCGWERIPTEPTGGTIVGLRFPYTGRVLEYRVDQGMYEPPEYVPYRSRDVTHRVYLVATNIRHNPVRVLASDMEAVT